MDNNTKKPVPDFNPIDIAALQHKRILAKIIKLILCGMLAVIALAPLLLMIGLAIGPQSD